MSRSSVMVITILVFTLAAGSVWAQQQDKSANFKLAAQKLLEGKFEDIDTDGDGKISRVEYLNFSKMKAMERFDKVDKDKDKYITAEEIQETLAASRKRDDQGPVMVGGNCLGIVAKHEYNTFFLPTYKLPFHKAPGSTMVAVSSCLPRRLTTYASAT